MSAKLMSNPTIKPFVVSVLIFLFVFSGHGAFSAQKDEESKVIFFVR